ncbi:uncharacterized protein LOC135364756 isoform X2 [Mirounga angustirostris]|uniref:uncharacterized protein LOC135364756 isoform X2 n=1 Tax=Mirounga angustirostris TaxID=9716 RepID=UPI00313D0AFE
MNVCRMKKRERTEQRVERHQQSKQATGCGQKGASLPAPSPPTAMRDLSTTQSRACWQEHIQKETTARGAWKINYGHKYLKEGPMPRKRLQRARLGLALGAGPLAVTSSPESKEVQDGRPETKGVRHQLSRGVGVQGSPPKGDKVWETQRGPQGPAVQTRPEGLEMRQVPPSTLQLLFQGISHDGQGRASYLRERHRRSRRSFCTRSCHPGSTAGTWSFEEITWESTLNRNFQHLEQKFSSQKPHEVGGTDIHSFDM